MQPILTVRDDSTKTVTKNLRRPAYNPVFRMIPNRPAPKRPVPPAKSEQPGQPRFPEESAAAFLADTPDRLAADWQGGLRPQLEYVPDATFAIGMSEEEKWRKAHDGTSPKWAGQTV